MKNSTKEQLEKFRKKKSTLGIQLIIIGLLGIFLPLIPGLVLAAIGISLIFPQLRTHFKTDKH